MSSTPRNAVALLFGIGHYQQGERIAGLQFAARDARSLARLLSNPAVCAFPPDNVTVLTEQKASRSAIIRHLSRWLPERAAGADLALIYFAGHGTSERHGALHEEGYLLPHDADADDV